MKADEILRELYFFKRKFEALTNRFSTVEKIVLLKQMRDEEISGSEIDLRTFGNISANCAMTLKGIVNDLSDQEYNELVGAAKKGETHVRKSMVWALGQMKPALAVSPLIFLLRDEDPKVRAEAASKLGHLKDAKSVNPLIDALTDRDSEVRWETARALGNMTNPNAVPTLIKFLGSNNLNVREAAIELLGLIGDERAVQPLIKTLMDESQDIKEKAVQSLKKITGKSFLFGSKNPDKWARWFNKNAGLPKHQT